MKNEEFLDWLKEKGVYDIVKNHYPIFKDVMLKNLAYNGERVLIIGDYGTDRNLIAPIMCGCYYLAAKELGCSVAIVLQEPKLGLETASYDLVERLAMLPRKSIAIMCVSQKLGSLGNLGKSFRKFAHNMEYKFLSVTGLSAMDNKLFETIIDVMDVDYDDMHSRGKTMKEKLEKASEVVIKTERGTNLTIKKIGVPVINNSGFYKNYGEGGNLPAGEVYFPPQGKDNVDGTLVIDGSVKIMGETILIKEPVTLKIQKGMITQITGGLEANKLSDTLRIASQKAKNKENVYRIAEIGIGTNKRASIVGPTLINEKTYGTAHVANGSNKWFGGEISSNIHLDHVFKHPEIYLDGERLEY